MAKDFFLSSYTNKKGEEKYSIGVTKEFLRSLYNLDEASFEEMLDSFSLHIDETDDTPDDEKIEQFSNFLKKYFSL